MVKVVGFPAPVDILALPPGTAFQVGDSNPPFYALTVKAGDRVTAIFMGQVKGQAAVPGYLQNQELPRECYAVDAELVISRTAQTQRREALAHGALILNDKNAPFLVIEQTEPFPRLFVSLETGEAEAAAPDGMLRIYGNWVLKLEANGKALTELTLNG